MNTYIETDSREILISTAARSGLLAPKNWGKDQIAVLTFHLGGNFECVLPMGAGALGMLLEIADSLPGFGLSRRERGTATLGEQLRQFTTLDSISAESEGDNLIISFAHPDSRNEDIRSTGKTVEDYLQENPSDNKP